MKTLNLFPYYERVIKEKLKRTSLRFGDQRGKYSVGDRIDIMVGWNPGNGLPVGSAIITEISVKPVGQLATEDLEGESPDCLRPEAVKYVLSAIYRRIVNESDH